MWCKGLCATYLQRAEAVTVDSITKACFFQQISATWEYLTDLKVQLAGKHWALQKVPFSEEESTLMVGWQRWTCVCVCYGARVVCLCVHIQCTWQDVWLLTGCGVGSCTLRCTELPSCSFCCGKTAVVQGSSEDVTLMVLQAVALGKCCASLGYLLAVNRCSCCLPLSLSPETETPQWLFFV